MSDMRTAAKGTRDNGEFKPPVGIVNKTWRLAAVFLMTLTGRSSDLSLPSDI